MFGLDQFYLQWDYSKKKKTKNSHVVYQKRGPACALFKIGNVRASPKIFRECYKQKSIRATTPRTLWHNTPASVYRNTSWFYWWSIQEIQQVTRNWAENRLTAPKLTMRFKYPRWKSLETNFFLSRRTTLSSMESFFPGLLKHSQFFGTWR